MTRTIPSLTPFASKLPAWRLLAYDQPVDGAQALMASLVGAGVDVCFMNPGTSEMHFVSALDSVPAMRGVLALFEGVATGAADGYARMAGRPAAVLLHLGPGLANGLANLHNARRAGSPVLTIVGAHATDHVRYDAPLQSDIEALARTVSGWVRTCGTTRDLGQDAVRAVTAASRGQIATLVLPADVSWGEDGEPSSPRTAAGPEAVADDQVGTAAGAFPVLAPASRPAVQPGPLTAVSLASTVAASLPEHAIVADEANTSGFALPRALADAPRHSLLTLTGGSIGQGLPVATGAAIAAPDRPVVSLEGDGSAMYTIQALWTQAREQLDVTTVLINNAAYAILRLELARTAAGQAGPRAERMLDLSGPTPDFTEISTGLGVPATRATTGEELNQALRRAYAEPGPHLIEAMVPPVRTWPASSGAPPVSSSSTRRPTGTWPRAWSRAPRPRALRASWSRSIPGSPAGARPGRQQFPAAARALPGQLHHRPGLPKPT